MGISIGIMISPVNSGIPIEYVPPVEDVLTGELGDLTGELGDLTGEEVI